MLASGEPQARQARYPASTLARRVSGEAPCMFTQLDAM